MIKVIGAFCVYTKAVVEFGVPTADLVSVSEQSLITGRNAVLEQSVMVRALRRIGRDVESY